MEALLKKKYTIKILAILLVLLIGTGLYIYKKPKDDIKFVSKVGEEYCEELEANERNTGEEQIVSENQMIVVDVAGEVKSPSVYFFSKNARVYEAVEAAGGLTETADTSITNMAAPLVDGTKLYIPNKKDIEEETKKTGLTPGEKYVNETTGSSMSLVQGGNGSGLININKAESTELQKLSGVGPSTAEKIITYRNEFGQFKRIEDLMNVSGIGEKTFAKLKKSISVE